MSTRNSDINLVIRAKTEGEKAIASLADAVSHLVNDAGTGSTKLAEFGKTVAALDKAASGLSAAQEKVGGSASKQAAAIHAASAGIAEQKSRIADLQRGIQLLATEQDKAFVGPRRNGLTDLLKVAKTELRDAEGQLARFTTSFDRNLSALQTSRSGLLDLKRSTDEIGAAQVKAQASLAGTTAELERQERAGRALAAIQRSQPSLAGKSAEESASVFARSGRSELERSLDAADKLRAEEAAMALSAEERAKQEAIVAAELERQERAAQSINAIRRTQPGPSGKSAEESAGVFARGGLTGVEQDIAAADRLRAKLDPLAAIQATYNSELARYRDLAAKGRIFTEELAQAEAHLKRETDEAAASTKRAGSNRGAFRSSVFGLQPYELQNLSYQVNDVITQLASGASLARTLGQQGGQIVQIFPRISSAIFSAFTNPAFLGAAAVVGAIALGLKTAADQAERLRNVTADLGRRANGGDYKAGDVAEQERQLQRLGVSASNARSTLGTLIDAGVPLQSLGRFATVAKNLSDVLGVELPDAAKQVTTAFTGGYQAIAELDNRLNFLTGTQREHIRQLFEEGRGQQAQTEALNIFAGKMDTAATSARGPWASANRELTKSWHDLLDSFADTKVIQAASNFINGLADAVDGLAKEQDAAVGAIRRQAAGAHELSAIQKETKTQQDRIKAEERQAQQERNQTIQRYLQRIGAAEGGAGANRAGSSALGIGQFTRGTFVDTYRRANPGTQLNNDQIADLRRNPAVAQQILDVFTRQNAQFLTNLHQTISGANLYLIHFLGQGTGGAALRAPGSTPIDQIIRKNDPNAETVLRQNRGYLFDKDKGRYRTRSELQTFLGNRVGDAAGIAGEDSGSALVALQANEARIIEAAQKKQEELNQAIRHGNEDRQRGIDAYRAQDGKLGADLIDVQRLQVGSNAVEELRQRVEDINRYREEGSPLVTVTDQQINEVKRLAEALFDVQHERERIAALTPG